MAVGRRLGAFGVLPDRPVARPAGRQGADRRGLWRIRRHRPLRRLPLPRHPPTAALLVPRDPPTGRDLAAQRDARTPRRAARQSRPPGDRRPPRLPRARPRPRMAARPVGPRAPDAVAGQLGQSTICALRSAPVTTSPPPCNSSHIAYFRCATAAAPYCEQGQCSYPAPASAAAGVQPKLLTLTAAALERSSASMADQVFACPAIGPRYSPHGGLPSPREPTPSLPEPRSATSPSRKPSPTRLQPDNAGSCEGSAQRLSVRSCSVTTGRPISSSAEPASSLLVL